jgi:hypothetical protein
MGRARTVFKLPGTGVVDDAQAVASVLYAVLAEADKGDKR